MFNFLSVKEPKTTIHNVRNTIMKFILTIALIAKTGLLTPEKVKGVPMDCAFAQTV